MIFPTRGGLLIIEGQYVGKNIYSALNLAENSGRWIEKACTRGYTYQKVMPSEWQTPCGIFPKRLKGLKDSERTKMIKDQSIFYARNIVGGKRITEHEADAINIGQTYINKYRIQFI